MQAGSAHRPKTLKPLRETTERRFLACPVCLPRFACPVLVTVFLDWQPALPLEAIADD